MPVSTAQRWAKSGMPVTRSGRNVVASRECLDLWMHDEVEASASTRVPKDKSNLTSEPGKSVHETNRQRIHRVK
jgi:hypothetical protein